MLIKRSQKIYSFSHLTFQEYLVAKWFCDLTKQNILTGKISQLHWREVFLLNSEMATNLNSLLTLIELSVSDLVGKDQKIQNFLMWVSNKVDSVTTNYKSVSLRAFYFETAFTLVIAPQKANDAKLVRLNENGGLLLFLEGAFSLVLTHSYGDGIQKSGYGSPQLYLDYMLIYALVLSLTFKNTSIFSRQLFHQLIEGLKYRLERALESAKEPHIKYFILENKNDLLNFVNDYFQDNRNEKTGEINGKNEISSLQNISQLMQSWSQSLRNFMIKYCDIGHDWKFSDSQVKMLREYYYANVTLAQCLNGNNRVSAKFRRKVEETMMLPLAEIEKQNLKKNH